MLLLHLVVASNCYCYCYIHFLPQCILYCDGIRQSFFYRYFCEIYGCRNKKWLDYLYIISAILQLFNYSKISQNNQIRMNYQEGEIHLFHLRFSTISFRALMLHLEWNKSFVNMKSTCNQEVQYLQPNIIKGTREDITNM